MNINELIGQRVLLVETPRGFGSGHGVDEYRILELSPSGQWIKVLRVEHGRKFWKPIAAFSVVETLKPLEPAPRSTP